MSSPAPSATQLTGTAARTVDAVKIYGSGETAVRAVDGVTIDFPVGQFAAVMGPSGSGKSTLMHCMAGLDTLSSGSAELGGVELSGLKDKELTRLRRTEVGFVFQAFNLVPTLSLRENIELPRALAGEQVDEAWFTKITSTLGIEDRLAHVPSELSGGQQQRGAIARALVAKPSIVFADEPTGNLDSKSGIEVLEFLRRVVDDLGQTVIMVTHDPGAAAYADRVVYLVDGKIVREQRDPTREDVLDAMKHLGEAEG